MKHHRLMSLLFAAVATAALGACHTSIVSMRPLQKITAATTQENAPATAPSTQAAAPEAAATEPTTLAATRPSTRPTTRAAAATRPAKTIRVVDPNETTRFVYKATYDNVWQQAMTLLTHTGFTLDERDYRLGRMTTHPLPSSQFIEFWKPQQVNLKDALENSINSQRRSVRLTITPVPGKPDFYTIGMQVLVERQTNPTEVIGGPVFVTGSGFGRNAVALQSDYVAGPQAVRWVLLGHDPDMEKKLLDELFKRI